MSKTIYLIVRNDAMSNEPNYGPVPENVAFTTVEAAQRWIDEEWVKIKDTWDLEFYDFPFQIYNIELHSED